MTGSNSLASHCGESSSSPATKMTGWMKCLKKAFPDKWLSNRAAKSIKKKTNRKRRMFLKNPYNWDKI